MVPGEGGVAKVAVQRAFTILNEREFVNRFKRPVRSKDPKVVTIQMETETAGQKETFYVFRDAADPYAKLVVQQEWGEDRAGLLLDVDKHVHRQQAVETANARRTRRMTESQLSTLMQQRTLTELATVDEHYAKIHGEPPTTSAATEVTSWTVSES